MTTRFQEINFLSKYENSRVSKNLKIFFLILRTVFMLDYGYKFESNNVNIAVKYFILVVSSLCAFLLVFARVFELYRFSELYCYLYTIEYLLNIYILLLCDQKKSFYAFIEQLYLIDFELNLQKCNKTEIALACYVTLILLIHTTLNGIYYYLQRPKMLVEFGVVCVLAVGIFFSLVLSFYMFYLVYWRLRKINEVVKNNCSNIALYQHLYKFLIDSTEKSKEVFDYLVSY